ncbi:MAG TPA: TSUP family transporter [Propionicimonas sp.]|nr:TSUP family transporter [Propionicimonas sp.]
MPEPWVEIFLLGAAFLAGLVDAVVGGGGLIQLPALLVAFPEAAPMQLLATNKLSSIAGTFTSSLTYYRRVKPDLRTALPLAAAAFGGSLAGALVASHIPRSAFDPVVLVALVVVGGIVVARPDLGLTSRLRRQGRRHYASAAVLGAAVGFYDGALGPGTGTFLVFGLVGWLGYGFLEASAKARIANLATNLAALVVFVPQGAVLWRVGLGMAAANVLGGYLGSRVALARGARFIRVVLLVVAAALALKIALSLWWPAG